MDATNPSVWLIPQNRPDSTITADDALLLQAKLYQLLGVHVQRYTQGDSSSVRIEIAEELLRSICFTLRLCLEKGQAGIDDLIHADDWKPFWNMGCKVIERELARGRILLERAEQSSPPIENISYRDTLTGLAIFFREYDRLFFAHQIPGDIDYQLCHPVPEERLGIEYVNEYLRRLVMENTFVSHFDANDVISLLERYAPNYKGLLINLYEPVAANAVGSALLGQSADTLRLPMESSWELAARFADRSRKSRAELLIHAAQKTCFDIGLNDAQMNKYVRKTALDLLPRIENALAHGGMENIFIPL